MHRELLDALSVITEEEQRILDEQRGIDPQLYTENERLSLTDGLRLDVETERRRNLRPRGGNR